MKEVKYSDILKAAKKRLKPTSFYVCHAIEDCGVGSSNQHEFLTDWIEEMLDGEFAYGSWLYKYHPKVYSRYPRRELEARLPWVDYMISYWEERGQ